MIVPYHIFFISNFIHLQIILAFVHYKPGIVSVRCTNKEFLYIFHFYL